MVANTEINVPQNVNKIKEALGQEVIPELTGKPSRVLKDQKPKKIGKKITAGGAALYEIAAAIKANPGANVVEVIKQGQKEAKERLKQEQGGALRRGTKSFLTSALGPGLGGWLAEKLGTKTQKEGNAFEEVHRQYEEGGKFKSSFLKGLLGENIGGKLARATTSMNAKVSAFEKYKQLTENTGSDSQHKAPVERTKKPVEAKPKAKVIIVSPQKEEAKKALEALGYTKEEIRERLQDAPEGASTEEIIKHGLNPTAQALPAPIANVEAARQLQTLSDGEISKQEQAEKDRKEEDEKQTKKEDEKWKKEVKEELEEVKKNTDKKGGLGWLLLALGAAIGVLIYKYWDKIKAAYDSVVDTVSRIMTWIDENVYTPLRDFVSRKVIEPIEDYVIKPIGKIWDKVSGWFGGHKDEEPPPAPHPVPEKQRGIIPRPTQPPTTGPPTAMPRGTTPATVPTIPKTIVTGPPPQTAPAPLPIAAKAPAPLPIAAKAPAISPSNMAKVSQSAIDAKQDNDVQEMQEQMMALTGAGNVPNPVDQATLRGVQDIKAALPALAASKGDSGGALIKVGNDESSVAGYMGQIYDHPATWGAKP